MRSTMISGVLAAALAAAPLTATAQSTGGTTSSAQSPQGTSQGQNSPGGQAAGAQRVNALISQPMPNGCRYIANVRGTIRPSGRTAPGLAGVREPLYQPDLTIGASVGCPNEATIRVDDFVMRTPAMTRDALEGFVESRASVVSDASGHQCVYLPDFEFAGATLRHQGVTYLCAQPAAGRGGGPAGSQDRGDQTGQGGASGSDQSSGSSRGSQPQK